MELKFNSVEEVLDFADTLRRHTVAEPGVIRPGSIDPAALVRKLADVSRGGKIAAIQIYRAVTGQGLKDSKEAVERAPEFVRRDVPRFEPGCGDPECGCGDCETPY